MKLLRTPVAAQEWCRTQRARGASVGFVPTMGALHAGHLALIERSVQENELTVVSVFVNPLQFEDAGDYEAYPVDLESDANLAGTAGADLVFSGSLEQFFVGELDPSGALPSSVLRDPGPAALGLEGKHRSGHFAGVATIVARLFQIVLPTRAYFGAKDYQQTQVVAGCRDGYGQPEIVVCPTLREPSGLALSSRNSRLSEQQRCHALHIVRALTACEQAWDAGIRTAPELEAVLLESLALGLERGEIELEYGAVRAAGEWCAQRPEGSLDSAVALVAARVGGVRLIDNTRLDLGLLTRAGYPREADGVGSMG